MRDLPLALQRVHAVLDVLGRLEAVAPALAAESADVGLVAPVVGDLGLLARFRLQRHFAEEQLLAEGAREHALVVPQPRDQARRSGRDRADDHVGGTVLPVLLVRPEELHAVLRRSDRRATRPTASARSVGFGVVLPFTKQVLGVADHRLVLDEALVLIEVEELARVPVAAAPGDRGNDGARRLLVLGLEVLRQDLELLHRVLRERVAAARSPDRRRRRRSRRSCSSRRR